MDRVLFHGSELVIARPELAKGRSANDYGKGFYCTEDSNLAGEWACRNNRDGFINRYVLDMDGLQICNLNGPEYNVLNWLAVLTRHRGYWQKHTIAEEAKEFLQENFLVDLGDYDIIIGYRADDSYFSFAQDFISGVISYQKLARAMHLGKLGEQVVLKSERAFRQLCYQGFDVAPTDIFYNKKVSRDMDARRSYARDKSNPRNHDEIYILDIIRGEADVNELRL